MDWFLIKQNEHLGPFSDEVLDEMYHDQELLPTDLIWREGWSDAKTYQDVFLEQENEFQPLGSLPVEEINIASEDSIIRSDELPPDLPVELQATEQSMEQPHAGEVSTYVAPMRAQIMEQEQLKSVTPEVPDAEAVKPILEEPMDAGEMEHSDEEPPEVIDFNEYQFEYDKSEKLILGWLKKFAIVAIVLVVGLTTYLYVTDKEMVFKRPSTMSLGDYERLSAVAKADSSRLVFAFALASDKKTLWAATNNPLAGEIFINLSSKKGRILGRDIEVKAKGDLGQRLITFKDFQFIRGSRFIDGYYDVEIYTVDDLKAPFFQKFFKPTDKQFRFINEFLITSMQRIAFERQLKDFSARQTLNAEEFWTEVYQKYQTMLTITQKIEAGFLQILSAPATQWNSKIKIFRNRYYKEYGVFFTEFVKANEASYERLFNKDFDDRIEIIGSYQRLSALSKKIGEETVNLLAALEVAQPSQMDQTKRQEFSENSLLALRNIIAECERKISALKN